MPRKKQQGSEKSAQLGIEASKETEFGKWYTQVVTRGDLIDYYDVSGCYILRPNAYAVWESVQAKLNGLFKGSGVKNAYFPMFVSEAALTREKSHLEGFSPEVAWVTKAGDSELGSPVAVRPTSETIIYPIYARWIRTHRDLPLRINQWSNVVRWEFKDAVPFIRSREFLWQEGHSCYATQEEADLEVREILGFYQQTYEDLLAVPVVPGKKSEKEKFAGAYYTTTIEAFIPTNGRGVQAATSHCLGQTFSSKEMFNITFTDDNGEAKHPVQNSWGFTTRSIGVMLMVHSDNSGIVFPPRVAPVQVVILPMYFKGKTEAVDERADTILARLREAGIRCDVDRRPYNPGWKHNDHTLHGIPIRIEIGPRDVENNTLVVCRRDKPNKEDKISMTVDDSLISKLQEQMEDMHNCLLNNARERLKAQTVKVTTWDNFVPTLNQKCLVLAPWCEAVECENEIKKKSKEESEAAATTVDEEVGHTLTGAAKSLCIPFEQDPLPEGAVCFACGQQPKSWTLFGRSY